MHSRFFLNYDGVGSSILPSSSCYAYSDDTDQVSVYAYVAPSYIYIVFVCKQGLGPVPISVEVDTGISGQANLYQYTDMNSLKFVSVVSVKNGVFSFVAPAWSGSLVRIPI